MNELLSFTVTLPDWLFDKGFWSGVLITALIAGGIFFYVATKFNPFDR